MRKLVERMQKRLWMTRIMMYGILMPLGFSWASLSWPTFTGIYRTAYVLFGFSLIIFLHELGHFVVARACGVKCLAFSLGIGPRMFGWRKNGGLTFGPDKYDPEIIAKRAAKKNEKTSGEKEDEKYSLKTLESDLPTSAVDPSEGKVVVQSEKGKVEIEPDTKNLTGDILGKNRPAGKELGHTDYRVSWLPLGGYVRMLGQDDMDPTKVSTDPHAFNQRPIWQRMCIVSAGVTMNLIFAAVAFSILFAPGMGVDFPTAELGTVVYNSPAWKAGLRMGDRIVEIDHARPSPSQGFIEFTDIKIANALSSGNEDIQYKYVEPGSNVEHEVFIRPEVESDGFLGIGVDPMASLKVIPQAKLEEALDARQADFKDAGRTDLSSVTQLRQFRGGDVITAVNGKPVSNYPELYKLIQAAGLNDVKITVKNPDPKLDGKTLTLKPRLYLAAGVEDFPTLFGIGPELKITSVAAGGSAAKAKIEPGDILLRVGERSNPSSSEFQRIIKESAGRTIKIVVRRGDQTVAMDVAVEDSHGQGKIGVGYGRADDDMAISVRDEGVAGLPPAAAASTSTVSLVSVDDKPVATWEEAVAAVREKKAGEDVKFTFQLSGAPATSPAAAAATAPLGTQPAVSGATQTAPGKYEVSANFKVDGDLLKKLQDQTEYKLDIPVELKNKTQVAGSAGAAVMMGLDHTKKFVEQVYMTLAGLIRTTVSPSNLHGMLGISKVGYDIQEKGPSWFWYLMAMVSVNLAVANFLPLPIVDGGLFLLLILEKIRGKPLSLKVQSAIQVVGIVLLAGMFLYVTFNDLKMF